MSRDEGCFGFEREATALPALPHLQPAALRCPSAGPPSCPWQLSPRRGGAAM
jgi:hypothetical protein